MRFPPTLLLLLLLTCILNVGIFQIPFLGDEVQGLLHNRVVRSPELFLERMFSVRGLFQRPLSVLSFTLNYQLSGESSWSYHALNLLIHLVTIAALYCLALRLAIPAILAAAIFAVHPLSTACVAQIYGRPYSLGAMCMCLALYHLLTRRQAFNNRDAALQLLLWLLMLLSKQVFLFYPLLALSLFFFGPDRGGNLPLGSLRLLFGLAVLFGVAAAIGIFSVHILENLESAPVSPRVYFLSQLGNLPFVLSNFYLLPVRFSLFHELPWFYSFFSDPRPSIGLLLLSLSAILAVRFRHSTLALLGVCFFISYLPTNSIIPKGEVVMEWRLYPSLVFFSLFFAALLNSLSRHMPKGAATFLVVYLLFAAGRTFHQNQVYQSVVSSYQQVLSYYPDSAVAENGLGYQYFLEGEYERAEEHLLRAHQLEPTYRRVQGNLLLLYRRWGKEEQATEFAQSLLGLDRQAN